MDRVAIALGVADAAARAGRFHVCEQSAGGLEDPVAGAAAILDALVRLHVFDHVVGVCGCVAVKRGWLVVLEEI